MKTKKYLFIISFLTITILSCSEKKANDFQLSQKLEGCWVGGLLNNGSLTEDVELRLFKIKPESLVHVQGFGNMILKLIFKIMKYHGLPMKGT